jgi:hypothetical protein
MKYLIAGCSLWKFLAEKEVACDYIPISVSNIGDKLSMTTYISRLIDLKGEFPAEINFFPQNYFDVTWHNTNSAIDCVS